MATITTTPLETALLEAGLSLAPRYTLPEVQRILGCDLAFLRNLLKKGRLPVVKIGAKTYGYIRHEDLSRYFNPLNGCHSF